MTVVQGRAPLYISVRSFGVEKIDRLTFGAHCNFKIRLLTGESAPGVGRPVTLLNSRMFRRGPGRSMAERESFLTPMSIGR